MEKRWQMAWDFWRGGAWVLNPDHGITSIRWAEPIYGEDSTTEGLDPASTAQTSDFRWHSGVSRSFLWKNSNESRAEYEDRCSRACHFPIFQSFVNIFVAGILKSPPDRGDGLVSTAPWDMFQRNVDLVGTDIDSFDRMALALALVFGRVHAVVDRPGADSPAQTVAEQLDRGERTYSYLITPLDLVDWCVDEYGRFVWAVVREAMADSRTPGEEAKEQQWQYRVWHRDRWELWQEVKPAADIPIGEPNFKQVDGGPHPCGEVPISTLWATRDNKQAQMFCESPMADVLDFDRHFFNKFSELDEVERTQTFAILWLPEVDGESHGGFDASPFRAITGSSQAGAPQYISPDDGLPSGKLQRLGDEYQLMRSLSAIGRGKSEYSKEERSAEALLAESRAENNQMSQWSAATAEFDQDVHRLAAKWEELDDYPKAVYPTDFDARSVSTRISDLVQLNGVAAMNAKAMAVLLKRVVTQLLSKDGAKSDELDAAVRAIDDAVDEAEKLKQKMLEAPPVEQDEQDVEAPN